jgi:hypothetical protein
MRPERNAYKESSQYWIIPRESSLAGDCNLGNHLKLRYMVERNACRNPPDDGSSRGSPLRGLQPPRITSGRGDKKTGTGEKPRLQERRSW